jgi:hypothetical protein
MTRDPRLALLSYARSHNYTLSLSPSLSLRSRVLARLRPRAHSPSVSLTHQLGHRSNRSIWPNISFLILSTRPNLQCTATDHIQSLGSLAPQPDNKYLPRFFFSPRSPRVKTVKSLGITSSIRSCSVRSCFYCRPCPLIASKGI